MGVPQNGWFIVENPTKWMIWGYTPFMETSIQPDVMSQSTLSDPKVRLQSDLIESSEGFLTLGHTVFVISVGELIASSWNEFTCRYQSLISASVKFLPMELPFSLSHQNTIHSTKKKTKNSAPDIPTASFSRYLHVLPQVSTASNHWLLHALPGCR